MRHRAVTRFTRTVSLEEDGTRLDLLIGAWLARELGRPLSKSVVRKLIMAGAVRLAGRALRRPGSIVHTGARLEAFVAVQSLRTGATETDRPAEIEVLFEDDDVIAVAKPSGIPMHATADPQRADFFTSVRQMLGLPYLGLHHRLDVDTSGAVLFTKQERANAAIAEQFAGGRVGKVYHAIVARPSDTISRRWKIENRLAPGGGGRKARMRPARDGNPAVTEFAVLETMPAALLVEARPHTGRKHQIRAHLADSGLPIAGDRRYGGVLKLAGTTVPRVMLHASSLTLEHPITRAPLTIDCPYPRDFAALLAVLRATTHGPGRLGPC